MSCSTIPEVAAFGPQIFLERLPPPIPFQQLPARLTRQPIASNMLTGIPPHDREFLLGAVEKLHVPTAHVLNAAMGVQQLLRRSLLQMNALDHKNRVRFNQLAVAKTGQDIRLVGTVNGGGMIISGITGLFKSSIVKRMLELIAPEQLIVYPGTEVPGQYELHQVVFLYVDQPSNGSRGALMKRILMALDEVLGTDYARAHQRSTNLDTLLVAVAKLLMLHRVALIVIDEKQEQNFGESAYALEFVLFYLSLMNLGMSVVLIGNPLAYQRLGMFSQVMRRFSVGGIHRLRPATERDKWWSRDLVPGVAQFDVVDSWNVSLERRGQLGMTLAGGNPGLYVALQVEAQRAALRRCRGSVVVIEESDYALASRSPSYYELERIARALQNDAELSGCYADLPSDDEGDGSPAGIATQPNDLLPGGAVGDYLKKQLAQFKRQQTKSINHLTKQIDQIKTLSPDDMRMLGVTGELLSSLEDTVAKLGEGGMAGKRARKTVPEGGDASRGTDA